MNRRGFLAIISVATPYAILAQAKAEGLLRREVINALFRENSEFIRSYLPEKFNRLPLEIEDSSWIGSLNERNHVGEPYLTVKNPSKEGEVYGIIQIGESGKIISAGASVRRSASKNKSTPNWDLAQAVDKAYKTLRHFKWDAPSDMQLGKVLYTFNGAWEIAWHRTFKGVPEVKNDVDLDKLEVIIDEDGDGVRLTRWQRGPAPAFVTPKISQNEGQMAAARAIPKIMATNAYRSWMPKDLSPIELKQFDLCVTVPNWILDAKRYAECPSYPTERRLCWRATYLLYRRDKTGEKDGRSVYDFTRGFLYVFIDAVTGETVGGNMEPIFGDAVSQKFGNQ